MVETVRLVVTDDDEVHMLIVPESDDGHCTICLDDTTEDYMELQCGHGFHNRCLLAWLTHHGTCPVCRTEVPVPIIKEDADIDNGFQPPKVNILMKAFYVTSLTLLVSCVNYYSLKLIIDQPSEFTRYLAVMTLVVVDLLIGFWTKLTCD